MSEQPDRDEATNHTYRDKVNAPLRPETIAALNERLASGDYPVTLIGCEAAGFTAPPDRIEITYATRATTYAQEVLAELGIRAPTSETELDALIERVSRLIQDAAED